MNKISLLFVLLFIAVTGCAANVSKDTTNTTPSSGIYKTSDGGDTWQSSSDLYGLKGQTKKISYSNILFIKQDPQDSQAVYVGTDSKLYYSYNGGVGWFSSKIGPGTVNDITVDPKDKCTLYAAVHSSIFKSDDCSRTWSKIHFSSLNSEFFTAIIISKSDPNHVIVGSSKGKVLESLNAGLSWKVKQYVNSSITRFVDHPYENNIFYMVTPKFGIQKTEDFGITWTSLNELPVRDDAGNPILNKKDKELALGDLKGSKTFLDLKFDTSQSEGLIYASSYGIFRLINGEYWQEITILNKPKAQKIYSVAIDGQNGQKIYFSSNKGTFYRSSNGGLDWTVKKLPATGVPKFMTVVEGDVNSILVGFFAKPQ